LKPVVVQLIGSFDQGGSERQAIQLAGLLRQEGNYDIRLVCLSASGPLRDEARRAGFDDIPAFPLTSFYNLDALVQWGRFARYLRRQRARIVQTHDFYTNVFGIVGAALAGVPVRIAARREIAGTRTPAQIKVERAVFRAAHAIVANAGAVGDQLVRDGVGESRIVTIHNGLDPDRFALPPGFDALHTRRRFGLPPQGPLISLVANMNFELKDQDTFLRAAKLVSQDFPDAAFALAGAGGREPVLRQLAADLGLSHSTFFLGACHDVPGLLSVSTIGVLSSRAEGFSNAILEYMAASLPVVATTVGGAAEAVIEGETGLLVPARDPAAMAHSLLALLRDPERARRMGQLARRRVEAEFSCRAQLDKTLALYGRLLAASRARSRQ
jgi:glycosyltransferase involved in cell wall biosynthesis